MLRILKMLYGFPIPMFRWCILSGVVVVYSVIYFKTLQFPKWWKSLLQDFTNLNKRNLWQQKESQASFFNIEEWDFTLLLWVKYFIWSFLAVLTIILLRNTKLKNLLLNKTFSNFKLQKHRINDKIFNIVLLFLTLLLVSFLLLATITRTFFTQNYCVS